MSDEQDSAEDLYENAPCGYLASSPDGRLMRVNQTFLTWTGYRREELVGRRQFVDLLTAGGRIYHETHYAPLLQMQGSVRAIAMDLVRADGSTMPVLVNSHLRSDSEGGVAGVRTTVFDATDRKRYETELLAARRRAEQTAARLRVIEQVVGDLAAVSGVAEVCEVVARAGTDAFGAFTSAVWLADQTTEVYERVAAAGAHADEAETTPSRQLDDPMLQAGEVVAVDDEHALVLAPLGSPGQTLGVLSLRFADARALEPEEVSLLRTLGRQAGQAVERARLFDEQRHVASTLQSSMLPGSLPSDPRLRLSACYRPAVDGLEVGGDWYDAFRLDPDRIGIVVGDVVGRGLDAAVAMGQLRSAVRALAGVVAGPAQVLDGLDRFVEGVEAAQTATLAYAEVDLVSGTFRYACAGHPPPVLIDPAGNWTLLWDGRSAPLGARFDGADRDESVTTITPGSRFALYTDGLVERRDRALDDGIERLADELSRWGDRPFAGLAQGVSEAILGRGPTGDDVCLLAVSYDGP